MSADDWIPCPFCGGGDTVSVYVYVGAQFDEKKLLRFEGDVRAICECGKEWHLIVSSRKGENK